MIVYESLVDAVDSLHESLPLGVLKSGALCMREVYVAIEEGEVALSDDEGFAQATVPACLVRPP